MGCRIHIKEMSVFGMLLGRLLGKPIDEFRNIIFKLSSYDARKSYWEAEYRA